MQTRNEEAKNSLPVYRCHKTVRAAKIIEIVIPEIILQDCADYPKHKPIRLVTDLKETPNIFVSGNYMIKHNPHVNGYYMLYEDGYESFSPARPFEGGYTRAEPFTVTAQDLISGKDLQQAFHESNQSQPMNILGVTLPTTKMMWDDFAKIVPDFAMVHNNDVVKFNAVATAAIKHALLSGQVVLPPAQFAK